MHLKIQAPIGFNVRNVGRLLRYDGDDDDSIRFDDDLSGLVLKTRMRRSRNCALPKDDEVSQ